MDIQKTPKMEIDRVIEKVNRPQNVKMTKYLGDVTLIPFKEGTKLKFSLPKNVYLDLLNWNK